jgi:uncharacterized protein YacL
MARTPTRPGRFGGPNRAELPGLKTVDLTKLDHPRIGSWLDRLTVRVVFALVCVAASWHFQPFGLPEWAAAVAGLAFAGAVMLFELRLEQASLKRLIGAAVGSILGMLGAYLISLVLAQTLIQKETLSCLDVALLLVMAYVGLIVGANKGDLLNLQALGGLFGGERTSRRMLKLLDTSVIIDGRVADIVEAQFLDSTMLIPQFVLRELQLVADSADPLKRQRGRRGLEVLQRIQKMPHVQVEIADDDFPHVPDVDMKLIEMAKRYNAKIVTNDFNLNKVASLQGIEILNVNQLANALKPVVLPGESMRVFILREGKEYNQGVAYLDDGTMVVVDGARKMINKTIDITVTSVHQTTAGKMIFGRYDERGEQHARQAPPTEANGGRSEAPQRSGEQQHSERGPRPVYPDTEHE